MSCSRENCFPEEETGCAEGNPTPSACPHYKKSRETSSKTLDRPEDYVRMPWSGRAIGEREVALLAARSRPTIVSVVGPHDAGKTTLLAAIFLTVFDSGGTSCGRSFAGSRSFEGWHDVSAFMKLDAEGTSRFPPHTPDSEARVPGLLHLAFSEAGRRRDLLFADAPGEWFSRWSREPSAEGSKGAAWVTSKARRNLLVADSEALSGEDRFSARERFDRIAGRLADVTSGLNTALVWTKSDLKVADAMRTHIKDTFTRNFSQAPVFRTQVPIERGEIVEARPASLLEVLNWTLLEPESTPLITPRRDSGEDPFLAYGTGR